MIGLEFEKEEEELEIQRSSPTVVKLADKCPKAMVVIPESEKGTKKCETLPYNPQSFPVQMADCNIRLKRWYERKLPGRIESNSRTPQGSTIQIKKLVPNGFDRDVAYSQDEHERLSAEQISGSKDYKPVPSFFTSQTGLIVGVIVLGVVLFYFYKRT